MHYRKELISLIKRAIKHELITGSFWVFSGGILGSFLSFIFNLFLARKLSYSDYGIYTSLSSFSLLLGIPAATLGAVIVRFAASYFSKNETRKASSFYKQMLLIWGIVSFSVSVVILSLGNLILEYLHLKDIRLVVIVAFSVGFSYFGVVNRAFLQSLTKFSFIAITALVGNILKILFGGILVLLGYGVIGALGGALSTPVVVLLLGFAPLVFLLRVNTKASEAKTDVKDIIYYALPASISLISLSSFFTTDIILVKHFFPPVLAGYYGGLSVVGKVIFYFTLPISTVMFPLLVRRHAVGRSYRKIYYLSLILVGIPSIAITIFYFLFPELNIRLFLGGRQYLTIVPYLGLFGIFITLFNFLNITVNFYLSLKKTVVSIPVLFFALIQFILIYLFHDSFFQVIYSSIFSISALLLVLLFYFLSYGRNSSTLVK